MSESFGQTIKRARFSKLLELKEAADKMGICSFYLSRVECDRAPATRGLIKSAIRCGFITEEQSQEFIQELFDRKNKRPV